MSQGSIDPALMRLVIQLRPDGKVDVTGPLIDKIFCYGLLKMAEEVIRDFKNGPPFQRIDGASS